MTAPLTLTIGGNAVSFDESTFTITQKVNERMRLQCTVLDYTGTLVLSYGEQVVATDAVLGVIFSGYLIDDKQNKQNTYPNPLIEHQIDTIDGRYLADKRTTSRQYTEPTATGKIVVDLWNDTLKAEGVNAYASTLTNTTQADFATGTLSGTAAASTVGDGDLELSPAGTTVTFQQSSQADFNAGTTNGGLSSPATGGLTFTSTQAIKLTATASIPGISGASIAVKIWSGSYTIAASDTLLFDVWIADSCPQQMASVDLIFTDGTALSMSQTAIGTDAQGVGPGISNDLAGLATNQWYSRRFFLDGGGAWVGKVLQYATVSFGGSNQGNYTAYFRNIRIMNGGTTQVTILATTATSTQTAPQTIQNSGYINMTCTVVVSYERHGFAISPAYSLASAGIVRASYLTWGITLPTTNTSKFTFTITATIDGYATFLPCTMNAAIPGLLPGMNLSGKSVQFVYVMDNAGNDPTLTPLLSFISGNVSSSYACTKSDIISTTNTQAGWNAGTITNLIAPGGAQLQLNGVARNWDDANYANQTLYGSSSPSPGQGVTKKQFTLTTPSVSEARSRLDFAGTWQNFTAEVDVVLVAAAVQLGFVYRTTGWQNANDTYGYTVTLSTTQVILGYGTNTSSGGGAFTNIDTVSIALTAGQTYHLKIVVNGNSHQVFVNDVRYINATDSTYTAAGYLGLRIVNSTGGSQSGPFDNFGLVAALSGTWVSPAIDIHSLATISNSQIILQTDPSVNYSLVSYLVEISLNNGSTWTTCPNNVATSTGYYQVLPVPGLSPGTNVASMTQVLLRLTITATTASVGAYNGSGQFLTDLTAVTLWAIGAYSSTGTRSTAPLGNDTQITRTVGSGWGTAFDGQAWSQTGTGTTAVAGGEETIASTSGDVHMLLGSTVGGDMDVTVRFQLSAATIAAGLELRYVDSSHYYRLAASTTTLSIMKNTGGSNITLASTSLSLTVGTWYRLRFRAVGAGPVNLYGKVWADGAIEPGVSLGVMSIANPQWTVTATN